ncbi:MAG: hypothetical protein ACI9DC_004799 [Gammaproteobacteria bacterium]|jgi:hypothetical protein
MRPLDENERSLYQCVTLKWSGFTISYLVAVVALLLVTPIQANAVVISTTSNGDWDVTTLGGNITDDLSTLSAQVW